MQYIEFVATFDENASPIDGTNSVTIEVVARTITSGITKALDVAKGYAVGREIVGVAFSRIIGNAPSDVSSEAFDVTRSTDFLATLVSRKDPGNPHYVR